MLQTLQTEEMRSKFHSQYLADIFRNVGSAFRLQNLRLAQLRSAVQGKALQRSAG
jgi:hypothetical protein